MVANKQICLDSDGPEPTNLGTDREATTWPARALDGPSPKVDSLPQPEPRGRPHEGRWLPSFMDKKTFPDEDRQGPQMDKEVLP